MLTFFRRVLADALIWARSKLDKSMFAVSGDTWLFLSGALAVTTCIETLKIGNPWLPKLLLCVSLIGSAVFLVRDILDHCARHTGWEVSPHAHPFPTSFSLVEENLPIRLATPLGTFFTSPQLNSCLSHTRIPVELSRLPYRLDGELRKHASTLLRRTGPASPFNGHCVRLDVDLRIEGMASTQPIMLRPARYFQALCSNQLTMWRITRDEKLWPFHDRYLFGPEIGPDGSRRILPLAASELANVIGISTLAVTTDDHLVLVHQSLKSGSSAGRWAPSGSGSLDPRDIHLHDTLPDATIRGAVRELSEECALKEEHVGASQLIGYGRWLDHGGKPEFVAVTALNIDSTMIRRKPRWRLTEAAWTQVVKTVPVDRHRLAEITDPWAPGKLLTSEVLADDDVAGHSSFPLEFGIRCLADALNRDPLLLPRLRGNETLGASFA